MRAVGRWGRQLCALALWGLVIVLVGAFVGTGATAGQEPNRAGLVVAFPDGRTEKRCVEFAEEEISGAELLRRSGLSVLFSGSGGLGKGVCRIDGTGCSDPGDCFCQCRGADCAFWTYFALEDGEWRFQNVGPSQRRLRDGDVDGWIWGSGRTPPEPAGFGDVCPLAAAPTVPPPTPAAGPPTERPDPGSDAPTALPSEANQPPSAPEDAGSVPPTEAGVESPATSADAGTPTPMGEVRRAAGKANRAEIEPPVDGGQADAGVREEAGSGLPTGLIAFGAVAGLLAIAIGGLALRRRAGG